MSRVRTRFAPSPTGDLHLGNVRVAVFNWLFARHHDGEFVLRIEDTDVDRSRADSKEGILRDLRWLGLEWDEGPDVGGSAGPYRQSEAPERYSEAARSLVASGHAYPCYCTEEELEGQAEPVGEGSGVLRYSGRCRELDEEERSALEKEGRTPAVRLRVPLDEDVEFEDEVRGAISFPARDFGDFIILRSDGRPTYNFAVVVDDARMEISHVIRGAGHLSNTPKQALLYDALDSARPRFAHLPTVLSPDGGKMSKREGSAAVAELRAEGVPPDGIVNYLSLLGWSSPDEREVLSREELVERISLGRLGASDTVFDAEKLDWVCREHVRAMDVDALTDAVEPHLDRKRFDLDAEELRRALELLQERMSAFGEVNEVLELLHPAEGRLEEARARLGADSEASSVLTAVRARVASVESWNGDALGAAVRQGGDDAGVGGRALYHPVREALTGATSGPSLGGLMAALGRSETLARLGRAGGAEEV